MTVVTVQHNTIKKALVSRTVVDCQVESEARAIAGRAEVSRVESG